MQTVAAALCGSFPRLFALMLLLHLIADYVLQGCLAQMKCKDWWEDQFRAMRRRLYDRRKTDEGEEGRSDFIENEVAVARERHGGDYGCALLCHSLMWALVVFAPGIWLLRLSCGDWFVAFMFLAQAAAHGIIDNEKANWHSLSLWQDQILHVMQIVLMAGFFRTYAVA